MTAIQKYYCRGSERSGAKSHSIVRNNSPQPSHCGSMSDNPIVRCTTTYSPWERLRQLGRLALYSAFRCRAGPHSAVELLLAGDILGVSVGMGRSRKNAAHFGYELTIEQNTRSHRHNRRRHCIGLPGGKIRMASEDFIRGILQQARGLAPVAVFVADGNIVSWLQATGYENVELSLLPKYTGFTRYVYRAERSWPVPAQRLTGQAI